MSAASDGGALPSALAEEAGWWETSGMWVAQGFPAPLVACRDAEVAEIPAGVARARKAAQGAGWRTRITYAQGTRADSKGNPTLERVRVMLPEDEEAGAKAKKYEDVPTGRFVVSETLALRCVHDDGRRLFLVWRRDAPKIPFAPDEGTKGYTLDCAWTSTGEAFNTKTLKDLL